MRLVPRTFLGKEQVLKTFVENDDGIYDFGGGVDGGGGEDDAGGDVVMVGMVVVTLLLVVVTVATVATSTFQADRHCV